MKNILKNMSKKIIIKTKEKKYLIEVRNNSIKNKLEKIIKNKYKFFIIIDNKVNYLIRDFIKNENLFITKINGSEKIKTFKYYNRIIESLIANGIDRNSYIVAIGGGTIGDIGGFIASTILRGVKFILIPTTLLSQVDSSIGGKNGINSISGKNLIGTFYQPDHVIIDPIVLKTLPSRQIKSGYAEIIKHALINDQLFFQLLDKNYKKILNINLNFIEKIIYKSIIIKSKFVTKDTKEKLLNSNSRAMLNFGHTFGHALETFYGYNNKLTHGEAISIGMIIASKISLKMGYIRNKEYEKIFNHFKKVGLPTKDKNMYNTKILSLIKNDKKNIKNNINLILLKKIGKVFFSRNINIKKIKEYIY